MTERAGGEEQPRHLVAVWNPSYTTDAMEEHLRVLLSLAAQYDARERDEDSLYVWWGKVRSPNRQAAQPHLDEIRRLGEDLAAGRRDELHLYLTDYRSLYVADVDAILEGDLGTAEAEHVPRYYAAQQFSCDFWLRLLDIRRLVADDMMGVIRELRALRNVHYADRPVSLFGGMVDLPLIVVRPDGARWFDEDERDAVTDGRLWAEFDAERSAGAALMERELRENLFGETAWSGLEPAARAFVATAEKLFREHRTDPAFDFAPVLLNLAKALEVQTNGVLRRVLPRLTPRVRQINIEGRTVDLAAFRPLTLGELARAIGGSRELNQALGAALDHGVWFTGSLPAILDALRDVRNAGAHEAAIDRRTAERWRNQLVGVGCAGDLVELARVKPHA